MKNKKGFTLIELMVFSIINGVAILTFVPEIWGAQAQTRDATRVADVSSISVILSTYFSDMGHFPNDPTGTKTTPGNCISDSKGNMIPDLASMTFDGKAPIDPQAGTKAKPCDTQWSYGYRVLERSWVSNFAYLITANVETKKYENFDANALKNIQDYDTIEKSIGSIGSDVMDPNDRIYLKLGN